MRSRRWISPLLVLGIVALAALPAASALKPGLAPTSAKGFAAHVVAPLDNQRHLYVLDGHGDVYPVGDSPALSTRITWPNKNVAYSLALFPDGTGGYVLNGWGALDPVGVAPWIDTGLSAMGFGFERQVVLAPWSSSAQPDGYVLDMFGGIHEFGFAPPVRNAAHFASDMARGMVLMPASTRDHVAGYTLDGFGGVHPFGGAPPVQASAYWRGRDVARGLVLALGGGYVLDQYGALHPFGGAPVMVAPAMFPSQDLADSIVAWSIAPPSAPGGWILDRHGGVHAYGSAPALYPTGYWPAWDIARGFSGGGGSRERWIVDPETLADGWGVYFNQRDARWGSRSVGNSDGRVWWIGCLLTDLAMVYTHFGFRGVTPGTIAANAGYFYADGQIANYALNIPGHPATINRRPSLAWITAQVAGGQPVIVGMNKPGGGTHFVVLTGRDGPSDFWANDPWDQNAMHVQFSGDWDDRGVIYEAIAYN
jgi:hypothetical protein